MCQALAACTDDPVIATQLLRLGQGPVAARRADAHARHARRQRSARALSLDRAARRYVIGARLSSCAGRRRGSCPACRCLPSGMFYMAPGPLTGVSRLAARAVDDRRRLDRATGDTEQRTQAHDAHVDRRAGRRRRSARSIHCCLSDLGRVSDRVVAGVDRVRLALYLVLKTDFLRPQGLDRGVAHRARDVRRIAVADRRRSRSCSARRASLPLVDAVGDRLGDADRPRVGACDAAGRCASKASASSSSSSRASRRSTTRQDHRAS